LSELGPRYFILHALSFPYELICDILEIRGERRGFVKSTSEEKKMIEEGEERERRRQMKKRNIPLGIKRQDRKGSHEQSTSVYPRASIKNANIFRKRKTPKGVSRAPKAVSSQAPTM
jgi:hypothetical protein